MAKVKKEPRVALKFVKLVEGTILFAVTGMPERTTAPKETAHYIVYNGNKNQRHKMKINDVVFATKEVPIEGKENETRVITNRNVVASFSPRFVEVTGKELDEMYEKCSPAFKKSFPR